MRPLIPLALLLCLSNACAPFPPEASCGFEKVNSIRVTAARLPVLFYVHPSVPPQAVADIKAAAEKWNVASGRHLLAVEPQSLNMPLEHDGYNIIYWPTTPNFANYEFGVAQSVTSGSLIYETDIRVNAYDYVVHFSANDSLPWPYESDLQSLMVHEFGHSLGLAHSQDPLSVMYGYGNTGDIKRDLTPEDAANIQCGY